MDHVAIDLGGSHSQICVRSPEGRVLEERLCKTAQLGAYLKLRPPSRVLLETCAEAFAIADQALAAGHDVRVVPATLVHALGVGARGIKTDRRDAQALSAASCRVDLPSVHVPSEQSRQRKSMCGMRDGLVESRTKLINIVRGWQRTRTKSLRRGTAETFTRRVRESAPSLPAEVEGVLKAIDSLSEGLAAADQAVSAQAAKDATCVRLMTVPGVGPLTAIHFVATLDEVTRFGDAHQVESYVGLVPREHSSGNKKQRLSITKAGSSRLRRVLIQASWSALRCRPHDPMVVWALEVAKRRGKRVALVGLARKLVGILYRLWLDGTTYNPRLGAAQPEA